MNRLHSTRRRASRLIALCLSAFGLVTATPAAPDNSALPGRAELEARVAAVRAAAEELEPDASPGVGAESSDPLAQWMNWPNWANWNNWRNWGNWGNWGNWFNR